MNQTKNSATTSTTHFDRRGPTYDASQTHQRIIAALVSSAPLHSGMRVLDIATGTGAAAFRAGEVVGPQGSVLGIDISDGMLAEARRKAAAAGLRNVEFIQADAEQIDLAARSFDLILCASALVMMRDIPAALRRWVSWLKPAGYIAFDVPAKPFGLSQTIAAAAAAHGVILPYDVVADTPAKCRALLEVAGFETLALQTEVVSDDLVEVAEARAFFETRLDHPAWRAFAEAPAKTRDLIRDAYNRMVAESATAGQVRSEVAQHFVYGRRKDAESS